MSEMVQVSVRMSPELKARLQAVADERVVSVSLLARTAIEVYLDNLEDPMRMLRASSTYEKPSRMERIARAILPFWGWWR